MKNTENTKIVLVISDVVKPSDVNEKIREYLAQNPEKISVRYVDESRIVVAAEYLQTVEEVFEIF